MCQRKDDDRLQACIRVLIVDDHPGVRRALATVLDAFDDLELAGEAAIGDKALPLCARIQPDVVLMDLVMPGMSSVQVIQIMHQRWPQIRIIALTTFQEVALAQEAIRAGAICCLLKNVSAGELANAIRTARADLPVLPSPGSDAPDPPGHQDTYVDPQLTPRERTLLAMMVEGLSAGEIAERLAVNPLTARFHIENILLRLGVTNFTEAVAVTLQHHLIP
jgi:NarL family two-component system response regulator LiaR